MADYGDGSVGRSARRDKIVPAKGRAPQNVIGGWALAGFALSCGWALYASILAMRPVDVVTAPTVTVLVAKPAAPTSVAVSRKPAALTEPDIFSAPQIDTAMFGADALGLPAGVYSQIVPLASTLQRTPAPQRVASIPMPAPRPAEAERRAPARTVAAPAPRSGFALASTGSIPVVGTVFEKIFGKPERPKNALAYAPADGGVPSESLRKSLDRLAPVDGTTAVYDITAQIVYMPDGTQLEAHSGLGPKMDDPRYVHVRMHGATPPHTYDLTPREALFHGVEAIRMTPVGGASAIHGRTGILAHSYMLGPNGQSNGCVSFKDYGAFLRAFKAGKVTRMVVVERGGRATMLAENTAN